MKGLGGQVQRGEVRSRGAEAAPGSRPAGATQAHAARREAPHREHRTVETWTVSAAAETEAPRTVASSKQ